MNWFVSAMKASATKKMNQMENKNGEKNYSSDRKNNMGMETRGLIAENFVFDSEHCFRPIFPFDQD